MAVNLNVNGINYSYPEIGDTNWGQATTLWAQAVTNGMLQKAGGSFPLTANVDFGGNYGLIAQHFTGRGSNTAQTGAVRLNSSGQITWRNTANTNDLPLTINVSDQLTFNGSVLLDSSFSGLTNSNIASNAAISVSKLEALTSSRVLETSSGGVIQASSVTSTELGYVSGVTSSIQTQLNAKLSLSGGTMTGSLLLAGNPTLSSEAATKAYVDASAQGVNVKNPVDVATTANITLSGEQTIDGVLTSSSRVLVKNQSNLTENGIYTSAAGAWSRTSDMNDWSELVNAYTFVQGGDTQVFSGWYFVVSPGGTIGVDDIPVTLFSQAGQVTTDGQGIEITGVQLSLELDGSTLSKSSAGLKVADSVISDISTKLTNPMTTNGDLITRASGVPTRLGIGTSGFVLSSNGSVPVWTNPNQNQSVSSVSGDISLTSSDTNKYLFVSTAAARSIQLPAPAAGLNFHIKDSTGQASTNNITLVRFASEQIEGVAASKVLQTNWGSWHLMSDGTNWFLV